MPILQTYINTAPEFTHSHMYHGEISVNYVVTLTAKDNENDKLLFRTGYLPAWLSITETTDTSLTLSGMPTTEDEGVNFFSITVSDGELSKEEHYAVLVSDSKPANQLSTFSLYGAALTNLQIHTTSTVPLGGVEQPYSSVEVLFNLSGTGSEHTATDFSASTANELPDEITLDYTTIDQYSGIISISGTLPTDQIHSNTIALQRDSESYQLGLSMFSESRTVGQITSVAGETNVNSSWLAGKRLYVSSIEKEQIILDEMGRFDFTAIDLSSSVFFEVDLGIEIQPVSISDAVSILKDIVGLSELSGSQKSAADMDGDGEITISDAVTCLKVIVGLEPVPRARLLDQQNSSDYLLQHGIATEFTLVVPGDTDGSLLEII